MTEFTEGFKIFLSCPTIVTKYLSWWKLVLNLRGGALKQLSGVNIYKDTSVIRGKRAVVKPEEATSFNGGNYSRWAGDVINLVAAVNGGVGGVSCWQKEWALYRLLRWRKRDHELLWEVGSFASIRRIVSLLLSFQEDMMVDKSSSSCSRGHVVLLCRRRWRSCWRYAVLLVDVSCLDGRQTR